MSKIRSLTPKDFLVVTSCCLYAVLLLDLYLKGLRWFHLLGEGLVQTLQILTHPVGVVVLAVGMTIFHLVSYSAVVDKVDLEAASFYASGPLFLLMFLTSYLSIVSVPSLANLVGMNYIRDLTPHSFSYGTIVSQVAAVFFAFVLTALAYLTIVVTISTLYRKRKKNIK